MRAAGFGMVVGVAVVVGWSVLGEGEVQGACVRGCPGQKHDAQGCCIGQVPPRAPAPAKKVPPAPVKKVDQTRGENAAIEEQRQQRVRQLQNQLQELQQQYADVHPAVRALKEQIRAAQADSQHVPSRPLTQPAPAQPPPAPAPAPGISLKEDDRGGRTESGAMVAIPAGMYMMGSRWGDRDEYPLHQVSVAGFAMDVTEVTVAAYGRCVSAGRCTAANNDDRCNYGKGDKANHPINCVDWNQATAYCGWAGKRLPTEEEWEYAARGTDGRTYPWGNGEPGENLCWKSNEGTCAVGSYAPGVFGLKDMAGNVWEWTSSGYSDDYSKNRASDTRVVRGGSWNYGSPSFVRSAVRFRGAPSIRNNYLGFRCARAQ